MKDPHRIALYLRVIAGEIAEAKGEVSSGMADRDTACTLDIVIGKLRDLADAMESADA